MAPQGSPLFTVVIPTYNRAGSVPAAVRSVLAQTDAGFECIVVDDGSTDDTRARLERLVDPRLRLVFNRENRGQHACRNQAIRQARTPWIAFLDSDDVFLPGRLDALRRRIEHRPSAGFWFTNAFLHRYGRIVGLLFDPRRDIPEGRVPGYYAVGDERLPYVTTMVAVRRSAFDSVGYFREDLRILEDTELYGRMFQAGLEVGVVREPLAVRFLHEGQITRDHLKDFAESMEALERSGAGPETASRVRAKVAREVAEYLWRASRPREAREFARKELGEAAGGFLWKTYVPAPALDALRLARRLYLRARYSPCLAPREFNEAAGTIEPFLREA